MARLAGRNISASHVAFTSTRVMGTCSAVGQAAGTAAALCKRYGTLPRQLAGHGQRLGELQQTLLRDDATIRGRRNEDPADLARRARVTASAERDEAKAEFLLDGFTRDIPKKQMHHWAARMSPEGAWIELDVGQAAAHSRDPDYLRQRLPARAARSPRRIR